MNNIETSFDVISSNSKFPSNPILLRNARYRVSENRFNGTYNKNVRVKVLDKDGTPHIVNWNMLTLNYYKNYTNKMDGLIFQNDPIIRTGNDDMNTRVNKLIEKTKWLKGIREAIRYLEIFGDVYIKTYKNGISAIKPYNCFTVVDSNDVNNILGHVLIDYILDDKNVISKVRFETHMENGYIYERVYKYNGVALGNPVKYTNKYGRTISENGSVTNNKIECSMIQHIKIDSSNGVYGCSPYDDFSSIITELERRQTLGIKVLDAHTEPTVAVATGTLKENEVTGKVENDVIGNIVEVPFGSMLPTYIEWNGKLDENNKMIDLLFSELYQISELGKTFMTGEYTGNISEESLNLLVKSAVDKANRHVFDIWYDVKESLYVLCKLNGINVDKEDINIAFNVGQSESNKIVSDIINSRVTSGTLSLESCLIKYEGLSKEQATLEIDKIKKERGNKNE